VFPPLHYHRHDMINALFVYNEILFQDGSARLRAHDHKVLLLDALLQDSEFNGERLVAVPRAGRAGADSASATTTWGEGSAPLLCRLR